jgi:multiple sugar transport system substrate-binding protein
VTAATSRSRARGDPSKDVGGAVHRRTKLTVVLATLAVVAPLGACASSSGSTPTLMWYTNPDNGGQASIAQKCTQQANGEYRLETSVLPRDAASQREQLARRLAAKDSSIDLMSLDPPFIPELSEPGFLAPIPQDVATRVSQNIVKGALAGATWKGKLVAVPFWANTQLLWYRKSVAQQEGLDPATTPVTWQQLMDGVKGSGKFLAVQGAKAESLTVWINALVESAGGQILENPTAPADQLKLGLETPAGRAAANIIGTIGRENLGGPALPTADENASLTIFQGNQGSYMVNWPFVWSAMNAAVQAGSLQKSVLDDVGWALYPKVDADKETRPPYGGINLGVGAFSNHTDLAFKAAECIVSPANQSYYFETNGNPPANTTSYDDPAVIKAFPMANVIKQSLEQAAPRPQTPYYNEVSVGLQETWHPPSSVNEATTPRTSTNFITNVLHGDALL